MPRIYTKQPTEDRFWSKVDKSGACWEWTRANNGGGYGKFPVSTPTGWKMRYAHRVAYELTFGPIPDDICVLHRCDNPSCVNPAHLFLGTHGDNMQDMANKGRNYVHARHHPQPCGEQSHRAKLKEIEVREIRALCASGLTQQEVGSRYGVSRSTVEDIVCGRTWRNVA